MQVAPGTETASTPPLAVPFPMHLVVLILAPFLLAGCLSSTIRERAFLMPRPDFRLVPEDLGLAAETLVVSVEGALLHAWRFRGGGAGDVLVVLGGNADNKQLSLPLARELVSAGYDVVLLDWRGYGLSTGEPTLDTLIPDALALVERVRADPATRRVAVLGISLGSPVALGAARVRPDRIDAVIVDSLLVPRDAMAREVGGFATFLLGWTLIPSGFDVAESARELRQPIFFLHGAADELTPLLPAAEVFAASRTSGAPREFWIATDAGHAPGIAGAHGPEYIARLRSFLDSQLAGGPRPARVEAEWDERSQRALVTLAPDAKGRTPVEVVLVPRSGTPLVLRAHADPGIATALAFPDARDAIGAFAGVPGSETRALEDGGWEYASSYAAAQRACAELEVWVLDRLGYGLALRLGGRLVLWRGEEHAREPSELRAACEQVQARLETTEVAELFSVHALWHCELWLALARRWIELEDEPRARAALERSLALLPANPFAMVRFSDSSWHLGTSLLPLATALEQLAELTPDPLQRASDEERARELRTKHDERTRFLADWHARQRTRLAACEAVAAP